MKKSFILITLIAVLTASVALACAAWIVRIPVQPNGASCLFTPNLMPVQLMLTALLLNIGPFTAGNVP